MAFSTFIVILIALSACRCSNADSNDIYCKEPGPTNAKTKICLNKPPNFDELRNKMDELVDQNKDWHGFEDQEELNLGLGGDENNCETITTLEQPYMLKTIDSSGISMDYVVQSNRFRQKIRYTRCINLNKSCFGDIQSFNIQTSCTEKFGVVSVYVYDHNLHKIVYKTVDLPVCCYCNVEKN